MWCRPMSQVNQFNTAVQTFPSLLLAKPLGFRAREFFSAQGDTAVPQALVEKLKDRGVLLPRD